FGTRKERERSSPVNIGVVDTARPGYTELKYTTHGWRDRIERPARFLSIVRGRAYARVHSWRRQASPGRQGGTRTGRVSGVARSFASVAPGSRRSGVRRWCPLLKARRWYSHHSEGFRQMQQNATVCGACDSRDAMAFSPEDFAR